MCTGIDSAIRKEQRQKERREKEKKKSDKKRWKPVDKDLNLGSGELNSQRK